MFYERDVQLVFQFKRFAREDRFLAQRYTLPSGALSPPARYFMRRARQANAWIEWARCFRLLDRE